MIGKLSIPVFVKYTGTIHHQQTVASVIRGDWAVHRSLAVDRSDAVGSWRVTHIPTSRAAKRNICCFHSARELAALLSQLEMGFNVRTDKFSCSLSMVPENFKPAYLRAQALCLEWVSPCKRCTVLEGSKA